MSELRDFDGFVLSLAIARKGAEELEPVSIFNIHVDCVEYLDLIPAVAFKGNRPVSATRNLGGSFCNLLGPRAFSLNGIGLGCGKCPFAVDGIDFAVGFHILFVVRSLAGFLGRAHQMPKSSENGFLRWGKGVCFQLIFSGGL
jgi:hypothetical protein